MKAGECKNFLLLFLLLAIPFAHAAALPLYDPEPDYSVAMISSIPQDGFLHYEDENVSFKWKLDIFLPDKSPLVGLGPFTIYADARIRLKEIEGVVLLPAGARFEGWEKYPVLEMEKALLRVVDGKTELTAEQELKALSFLGINMFDAPYGTTMKINNLKPSSATVYLPKTMQLWDYSGPATTFLLDEHTIFSYRYSTLSVIFFDPGFRLMVQIALGLLTLFFISIVLMFYKKIPSFKIKSKHLLIALAIACLLMLQFSFLIPNPSTIMFDLYKLPRYGESIVPFYMRYVLGFTDSVDALVIRNFEWCEENVFSENRNIFLMMKSARKIFIINDLEDPGDCIGLIGQNVESEKIEMIPLEAANAKKESMDDRDYPWSFLFDLNKRIVYGLFLVVSFLASGYLFLRAFEIKKLSGLLPYFFVILLAAFVIMYTNVVSGFLAHIPVTYHGATPLPFTMSANFLPFFHQGHVIRLIVLGLGVLSVFVLAKSIRKNISIRAFFIPLLIFALFLSIPQTEFSTKRALVGLVCGNCGIHYQGDLDLYNMQYIYAAVRANESLLALFEPDDREVYLYSQKLKFQGKYHEAKEALEQHVATHPDIFSTDPIILIDLGELYVRDREYENAIEVFNLALDTEQGSEQFSRVMYGLGNAYEKTEKLDKAIALYKEVVDSLGEEHYTALAYSHYKLGVLNERLGNYGKALASYSELVEKYPGSGFYADYAAKRINLLNERLSEGSG